MANGVRRGSLSRWWWWWWRRWQWQWLPVAVVMVVISVAPLNSSCLWLSKGEQKASLWNPLFIAACCCVWLLFFLVAVLQTTDRQLTDWQMCVQCQSVLTLFATCSTLHVNNCTFRCHFNTHFTTVQIHNRRGWYLSKCYQSPGKYLLFELNVNWLDDIDRPNALHLTLGYDLTSCR